MRLTPLAKAFIAVVVFAVIGFATWHYKGEAIKRWAGGDKTAGEDSKGDFDKLNNAPGDPARNAGSTGVGSVSIGTGRLSRPLVVGINTWAGHSPGIVFNNGMEPNGGSLYKSKYGWDFAVQDGAFFSDGGRAPVFRVAPITAFGFEKGDTSGQTRWRF